MIRVFGDFELDDERYELRRAGQLVKLEPKVFNILAYLIAHRDRVVSKQELFERLWPGEFVSDSALAYCIKAARQAILDDGSTQRRITTLHRRGYRFVAPLREQGAPEREQSGNGSAPFVGRIHTMAELERALAAATSGRGQLVLLSGEPGIGKTRTAAELATIAEARNVRVLIGRCYEGEGAPAFWPWTQILRSYFLPVDARTLASPPGPAVADLVQLLPELAERFPALAPSQAHQETAQARFRLFEAVGGVLDTASHAQPLAVILDDLHWADMPSLLLLQFVARAMATSRLLIVATYRDTDLRPQHPLAHALGNLVRVPNSARIHLDGLAADEVASFVQQALGRKPPAALVTAVHEETDGNPFFVSEVVRLLASSGEIEKLMANGALPVAVPPTVRDAINRRLADLSSACRDLLAVAAVIGRDFDFAILVQSWRPAQTRPKNSPRARATALQLLDEARRARIIDEISPSAGRYRFVHALIAETLADALPRVERARVHGRVGEAMEWADRLAPEAHLTELAHHFVRAAATGDVRKAVSYSVRAADKAAAQLAYEEAAAHYERALQLSGLDTRATPRRGEMLLALGHNQWRAGDFPRARTAFKDAAVVARADRSAEQFAQAALGYGGGFRGFSLGVVDAALIELLEEALVLLPGCDSTLRAQVTARLALALYDIPDALARRNQLSRLAVEMAERVGDTTAHIAALYSRHWAIWGPDNLEDREAAANAMVALAEQTSNHEMALQAHRFRLIDALERGDIERVTSDLAACEEVAAQLHQPYYTWYVLGFRALRAFLDGRFDESEGFAQEALVVGQRAQSPNVSQMYGAQLLTLRREQGRIVEVEPLLQSLVARFPTVPSWRCGLAYTLAELGRSADARAHFDIVAANQFSGVPRDVFWLVAMTALADVCVSLADVERAATLYRLLRPFEGRNAVNVVGTCFSSIARVLGRLAGLLGHAGDANRHFEAALEMETRLAAQPLLAHTQHDYAEVLLAGRAANTTGKAIALLDRALSIYERLHMTSFADKAASLRACAQRRAFAGDRVRPRVLPVSRARRSARR